LLLFTLALAAGAMLSAVLAIALLRELRLRRALEALLRRILAAWRNIHASRESDDARRAARNRDDDRRV
jgi:hypothetical protein